MSTNEIRDFLHKYIDIADDRFLAAMYERSIKNRKKPINSEYFRAGKTLSKEQLYKELKESEAEIEKGNYKTIEDFIEESDKW
ncbi:MAG: hypothetical protein JXR58_14150 [Bacteroidales bacterium]|nr:hypothetical protein [Bacteroidales bacterium]